MRSSDDQAGKGPGFSTRAIHAGQDPDPLTGAVVTPIHLASTFAQEAVGKHKGFDYRRTRNPTRVSLETTVASLEGASHGYAFSSGMAAADAVLRLLRPGDHLLIPNDAYGGTYRLVASILPGPASAFSPVELQSPDAWQPRGAARRRAWCGWRRRAIRSSTSSTSRPS